MLTQRLNRVKIDPQSRTQMFSSSADLYDLIYFTFKDYPAEAARLADLDPAFVRLAQQKLQKGTVYHADMTSFDVQRRYDVVLCLFSSIGYVRTLANVERALIRF